MSKFWLNVVNEETRVTKTKANKQTKKKGIVGKEMMLGKMDSNREKPQMAELQHLKFTQQVLRSH